MSGWSQIRAVTVPSGLRITTLRYFHAPSFSICGPPYPRPLRPDLPSVHRHDNCVHSPARQVENQARLRPRPVKCPRVDDECPAGQVLLGDVRVAVEQVIVVAAVLDVAL